MGKWDVTLASAEGNFKYRLTTGWDADKVEDDLLLRTAATQAWFEGGKKVPYQPIAVERING